MNLFSSVSIRHFFLLSVKAKPLANNYLVLKLKPRSYQIPCPNSAHQTRTLSAEVYSGEVFAV